ncbi:MAG: hypothetical protein EB127_13410, partial [Alphaproteobacteria bacterium]|nr:hypothetical protein [Alphaproteobacteria bacterium]
MRAKEFVLERKGTISHRNSHASKGLHVFSKSLVQFDRLYDLNRVMMAAAKCASSQNIALLHQLRDARNQLAVRIGFPSYADLVASDRMAGNPENAIRFLQVLAKALRPRLLKELKALRASKASHASLRRDEVTLDAVSDQGVSKEHVTLNPWDVSFYTHRSVKDSFNGDSHTMASEYLPLSAVISGLQGIMRKVFGVTMVSVDL